MSLHVLSGTLSCAGEIACLYVVVDDVVDADDGAVGGSRLDASLSRKIPRSDCQTIP